MGVKVVAEISTRAVALLLELQAHFSWNNIRLHHQALVVFSLAQIIKGRQRSLAEAGRNFRGRVRRGELGEGRLERLLGVVGETIADETVSALGHMGCGGNAICQGLVVVLGPFRGATRVVSTRVTQSRGVRDLGKIQCTRGGRQLYCNAIGVG